MTEPATQARSMSGRSTGLDLLRTLACLVVVAFHARAVLGVDYGPANVFIEGGDTGVWVFFALSGYLLYRPFVVGNVSLRSYAIKRAGRILPGYYVALVGLIVLTGSQIPFDHPLPYLTISSSYNIPLRNFMGIAWTLSAELAFYVTLPLIARLAQGRETFVLGTLSVISMTLAVVHRVAIDPSNEWMLGTYPTVFYTFVPGMMLAVLDVRNPSALRRISGGPFLLAGVLMLLIGAVTKQFPIAFGTVIGTPFLIVWLLHHPLPWARALAFGGGASYALYLWHRDLLLVHGLPGLLVAFVAAALSWRLVEEPILELAHKVSRRWKPAAAVVEPAPATS